MEALNKKNKRPHPGCGIKEKGKKNKEKRWGRWGVSCLSKREKAER